MSADAIKYRHELGSVVEIDLCIQTPGDSINVEVDLKGTCKLIVVGHLQGTKQEPLYILSDVAIKYPISSVYFAPEKMAYKYVATLVESGYAEEDLRPIGEVLPLAESVAQWLEQRPDLALI